MGSQLYVSNNMGKNPQLAQTEEIIIPLHKDPRIIECCSQPPTHLKPGHEYIVLGGPSHQQVATIQIQESQVVIIPTYSNVPEVYLLNERQEIILYQLATPQATIHIEPPNEVMITDRVSNTSNETLMLNLGAIITPIPPSPKDLDSIFIAPQAPEARAIDQAIDDIRRANTQKEPKGKDPNRQQVKISIQEILDYIGQQPLPPSNEN